MWSGGRVGRSSESKLKVDKVILNKDQKERPALNIEGKSKLIECDVAL